MIAVVTFAMLCPDETITEINTGTGSTRTRRTYAGLVKGAWKESTTWVAERAKKQGLPTDNDWQLLSSRRHVGVIISRGCGKTPASYQLKAMPEDLIPEEQRDAFVRRFVEAPEKEREAILRRLFDSFASANSP
jgi:hypothetical protein